MKNLRALLTFAVIGCGYISADDTKVMEQFNKAVEKAVSEIPAPATGNTAVAAQAAEQATLAATEAAPKAILPATQAPVVVPVSPVAPNSVGPVTQQPKLSFFAKYKKAILISAAVVVAGAIVYKLWKKTGKKSRSKNV